MSTPIADMVARLIAAGTPPEVAAEVVAEAFALGTVRRQSADHPVDVATENRRAYDRERQRKVRELRRQSADNPPMSQPALSVSSPSKDSEQPKEVKKVKARKHPLSQDWQPNDGHFEAAVKLGKPRQFVLDKAEDMRLWHKSSGELKADWDATLHGFMRRDASKYSNNGKQNGQDKSVLAAFDRLEQSLAGGDDHALREDDLLSLPPR